MDVNNKKMFSQIFKNLVKKGFVIRNYRKCSKSKVFMLENDITLLFVSNISHLRRKVWWWDNAFNFPCWHLGWYVMTNQNWDKDNAHQVWSHFKTRAIMKYYKFLWFENVIVSCWTSSSKWHHSSKTSTMAKSSLSWIL